MAKLKKGALYFVTGGDYLYGEVVELKNNDGTDMPGFTSLDSGKTRYIHKDDVKRLKKLDKKSAKRNSERYNDSLLRHLKHDKDVYLFGSVKFGSPRDGEVPENFKMFVDGKLVGTQYIWKSEIKGNKKSKGVSKMPKQKLGRKYVAKRDTYMFKKGDVLELVKKEFGCHPQFKRLSDGKLGYANIMDMKKFKEEPKIGDLVVLAKVDKTEERYSYVEHSMIPVGTEIVLTQIVHDMLGNKKVVHKGYNYALSDFKVVKKGKEHVTQEETDKAIEDELKRLSETPKFVVVDASRSSFENGDIVTLVEKSGNLFLFRNKDEKTQYLTRDQFQLIKKEKQSIKVGDVLVGKEGNPYYITSEGVEVKVIELLSGRGRDDIRVVTVDDGGAEYNVESKHFVKL